MSETRFFEYKCKVWNEDIGNLEVVCGVVYAKSFKEAMRKLTHYYDEIENVYIQDTADENVYEFREGTVGFTLTVDENGKVEKNVT